MDVGAFLLGGKANWEAKVKEYRKTEEYSRELKSNGKDAAESKAFEYATDKVIKSGSSSQQSQMLAFKSHYQRRNVTSALFPYATTTLQYHRKTWEAVRNMARDIVAKKTPKWQDVKAVINYGFVQPQLYRMAGVALLAALNPYRKDDEDDKKSYRYMDTGEKWLEAIELAAPFIQGNQLAYRMLVAGINVKQGDDAFKYAPLQVAQAITDVFDFATKRAPKIKEEEGGKPFYQWSKAHRQEWAQNVLYATDLITGKGFHNIVKQVRRMDESLYKESKEEKPNSQYDSDSETTEAESTTKTESHY